MNTHTEQQYNNIIQPCRELFYKKNKDYGTSWQILRLPSLTDQIFIKAKRIRSIEEKGTQKVDEGIESELKGIINYCVIALITLEHSDKVNGNEDQLMQLYDEEVGKTRDLMLAKNHDYGEAWRDMRVPTFTDMILMKLMRLKSLEENKGKALVSEGPEANYRDILNYAIFALIRMEETAN